MAVVVAAAVVVGVRAVVATALQRIVVVVGLRTESEVVVAAEQIVEAVVEAVET